MKKLWILTAVLLCSTAAVAADRVSFRLDSRYGVLPVQRAVTLQVVLEITGMDGGALESGPLDLAIIIDRSGSMSGGKLDDVKTAALQLLDRLSDRDRVVLISYASEVKVHLDGIAADRSGKQRLAEEIRSLTPGGITALGPAMIEGFAALTRLERTRDRTAHAVLLSDGRANHGLTDPDALGEKARTAFYRGISLSTLGVGMDYNEDLMTKLADEGGGRYHLIANSDEVGTVLEKELLGLRRTVAKSIRIRLYPGDGVSVNKIYGYAARQKNGFYEISVGSIAAGQKRSILVSLDVAAGAAGRRIVTGCNLLYSQAEGNGRWVDRKAVRQLALQQARDEAHFKASEDRSVAVRAVAVFSADRIDAAMKAVSARQFQQAKSILVREEARLKKIADRYQAKKLQLQLQQVRKALKQLERAKSDYSYRKRYLKMQKQDAYQLQK